MHALRSWVVLGAVACVSATAGIGQSSADPTKAHKVHGKVVAVDHKHHKFTVHVHHHGGDNKGPHHEHVFHVTAHTHFDFVGGQNKTGAGFKALHHGEHVVVHTTNGHPHLAHRVDIEHHAKQAGNGKTPTTAAVKPASKQ